IRRVYERYGFEPVETPAIEYTEALGKFLPDEDRPNEGVFSFQDEDEQWLSLRYDLTAPLARYVAENYDRLPKPYRSYREGYVFRNEKPGPGRFRQFMQFDADTVGTASVTADAEMCMMVADAMEALGIARGDYVVRVSSRKILDGVLESIGLSGEENVGKRLAAMRAVDKLYRLGIDGVRALLGEGRRDESGDFTRGAGLSPNQVEAVFRFVGAPRSGSAEEAAARLEEVVGATPSGRDGSAALAELAALVNAGGYGDGRVVIDPSVVRGLEYYTGLVFEVELTFETVNEKGEKVRFGSVAGGGRYDGLVGRFRGQDVPATGISIGVSRLQAALSALGRLEDKAPRGPVVVLVMDRERIAEHQALAARLRQAGIRAEMYTGTSGMGAQMKYADRRGAPAVVIQGSDERAKGEVTVKDLAEGKRLSEEIADRETWREGRPAQVTVPESALVSEIERILGTGGKREGGP
ncbi:MAG: histidine--tRNA ligase, partial [Hyphomicrobiales bacterium]|nr:histidine--tRNA ligase [Hyphomicrobiales bacterium]